MIATCTLLLASVLAAADAALARAADALGGAHDRRGAAFIEAARDALARSDLFAARVAVAAALHTIPSGPAVP